MAYEVLTVWAGANRNRLEANLNRELRFPRRVQCLAKGLRVSGTSGFAGGSEGKRG